MDRARWRDAVERCRSELIAALADGGPERRGGVTASGRDDRPSVRCILVNMIEEYAGHNGHADLIRESVDGLVGQDPPP